MLDIALPEQARPRPGDTTGSWEGHGCWPARTLPARPTPSPRRACSAGRFSFGFRIDHRIQRIVDVMQSGNGRPPCWCPGGPGLELRHRHPRPVDQAEQPQPMITRRCQEGMLL